MITQRLNDKSICIFDALSTDTKPTDCPNGSKLFEMDTKKEYRFDEETLTWLEVVSHGGGVASDVSYDNTSSGMDATTVQDAIDELKDTIDSVYPEVITYEQWLATSPVEGKRYDVLAPTT